AERKIRKGTFAPAVVALTELLKQQPRSIKANRLLVAAYLAEQLPEPALRVYRQMTQLFPKPLTLIGTILLAQRRPADAPKALEKSLEIAPDYMPAIERLVDLVMSPRSSMRRPWSGFPTPSLRIRRRQSFWGCARKSMSRNRISLAPRWTCSRPSRSIRNTKRLTFCWLKSTWTWT